MGQSGVFYAVGDLFLFSTSPLDVNLGRETCDAQKGNARSKLPTTLTTPLHCSRQRQNPLDNVGYDYHILVLKAAFRDRHFATRRNSRIGTDHPHQQLFLIIHHPLFPPLSPLILTNFRYSIVYAAFSVYLEKLLALIPHHGQQQRSILEQQWLPKVVQVFDLENVQTDSERREGKATAATAEGPILPSKQINELAIP